VFNPTKVPLKASLTLSLLCSSPCFASYFLVIKSHSTMLYSSLLLLLITSTHAYFIWRYCLLKSDKSVTAITVNQNRVSLLNKSGDTLDVLIDKQIYISSFLVFIAYYPSWPTSKLSCNLPKHLLICRYNVLDLNTFRRLRVVLRFNYFSTQNIIQ
jgi:hypothetical protein